MSNRSSGLDDQLDSALDAYIPAMRLILPERPIIARALVDGPVISACAAKAVSGSAAEQRCICFCHAESAISQALLHITLQSYMQFLEVHTCCLRVAVLAHAAG